MPAVGCALRTFSSLVKERCAMRALLLRAQVREQQHIPNRRRIRKQHH